MLQTVEAIVEPSGSVRLLEVLQIDRPCRAVVTLLESPLQSDATPVQTSADELLSFLERTRLPASAQLGALAIDAQIEDERNAWG
ncbi:MAG: hypothetical protein Q8N48_08375 [Thiobacillus sp.]|nr:hypothetical protein [Thiobacillus sp.]MDP2978827.1 hypothetical protein [Thiobacillus sp.]